MNSEIKFQEYPITLSFFLQKSLIAS